MSVYAVFLRNEQPFRFQSFANFKAHSDPATKKAQHAASAAKHKHRKQEENGLDSRANQ